MLALVLLLSGTALAAVSWFGSNYSYAYNDDHRMAVCDTERDGRNAYTAYVLWDNRSYYLYDSNGVSAGCGTSFYHLVDVRYHQTCEDRAGSDVCGPTASEAGDGQG
jgi:hypothetical protein